MLRSRVRFPSSAPALGSPPLTRGDLAAGGRAGPTSSRCRRRRIASATIGASSRASGGDMAAEGDVRASAPSRMRPRTPAVDVAERSGEAWDEIVTLGLERNIAELEATGLTVVEPERVAAADFADRLRAAIVRVGEE